MFLLLQRVNHRSNNNNAEVVEAVEAIEKEAAEGIGVGKREILNGKKELCRLEEFQKP